MYIQELPARQVKVLCAGGGYMMARQYDGTYIRCGRLTGLAAPQNDTAMAILSS